jgi:hypothetical protein
MKNRISQVELDMNEALRPWLQRASTLVGRRIRDARSSALLGEFNEAQDVLDELAEELADRLLPQARAAFFLAAFESQRSRLPADLVDARVVPTDESRESAMRAPINNVDQAADIRRRIQAASKNLSLAASVGASGGGGSTLWDNLSTWRQRHTAAITAAAVSSLSNAQIALDEAVGRILIRPELR